MRVGLVLPPGDESRMAAQAETHGLFAGLVRGRAEGEEMIAAAYAAAASESLRIVVQVTLGSEHPVTLAEELAVLDNISNGRIVLLAHTGRLGVDEAEEDLDVLRRAWAGRPLRHRGMRWKIPAAIQGQAGPNAVSVAPKPAQVDIPTWLTGPAAIQLSERTLLPTLATDLHSLRPDGLVQPGEAGLGGDLDQDRSTVMSWAAAGATHLFLSLPEACDRDIVLAAVSQHLAPEVGMPAFPRIVAESSVPLPWPDSASRE